MELESLEVIYITDYFNRCNLSNIVEIISCESPYNIDESDINDLSIVRLVVCFGNNEHKIYLYDIETQNNVMESPFIFYPVLFCFYAKPHSS